MFLLKNTIFKLFGENDKVRDKYKDVSGKGILQRYNELLAEEADNYSLPGISLLIDNTIVPNTILEKFIPYAENNIGAPFIIEDFDIRRKFLRFLKRIYRIKSTIPSYEIMFRILGFDVDYYITTSMSLSEGNYFLVVDSNNKLEDSGTVTINDGIDDIELIVGDKYYVDNAITTSVSFTSGAKLKRQIVHDFYDSNYSFDQNNIVGGGTELINTKFDDPARTFDMNCEGCSQYDIRLYGEFNLDVNLHSAIFRVIEFLEPVHAELLKVYYNDILILAPQSISIWIDENGDLNYNNSAVPDVTVTLTEDGNLIIVTSSSGTYSINENGDLIFTI